MNKSISIACLTSDLLGGRSFSINYHLLLMIRGLIDNFDVFGIYIYNFKINDTIQYSFNNIQKDFNIYLPTDKVRVIEVDKMENIEISRNLAKYEIVYSHLYIWSDALLNAKRINSNLKIVSTIHSIVMMEYITNKQRKWIGFDNFLRLQKITLAISDHIIFVSKYEKENARRLHGDIIKNSTYYYPVPEINTVKNRINTYKISKYSDLKLLFSGRWEYRKGIEQLIDCYFQCYAKYKMKLEILSDYNYLENYYNLFRSPVVKDKYTCLIACGAIQMIKWKRSREEYLEFLQQENSIAIVPSLYDPFNITAFDCITLGTPLVLSRFCGIEELVPDSCDLIYKVNSYDPESIYEGIMTISNRLLQSNFLKMERLNYTVKDSISVLVKVLNEIISSS